METINYNGTLISYNASDITIQQDGRHVAVRGTDNQNNRYDITWKLCDEWIAEIANEDSTMNFDDMQDACNWNEYTIEEV